jgi:Holliday junction DNA helicase RuvA
VIAFVAGRVAGLGPEGAVLDVGGVGLSIACTPGTLAGLRLGEPARLSTSFIVREDALILYGFADDDERAVFDLLLGITGIGPRLAQAVLAVHDPEALRRAVATEDLAALVRVPGVGRKGAQRLVLELKDKLGPPRGTPAGPGRASSGAAAWQEQVHGALLNLGWSAREADDALEKVGAEAGADGAADVATMLRAALKVLGGRP